MKSAEIFFEANSNVVFVRVLGSKNKLATTLPGYFDIFSLLWKLSALHSTFHFTTAVDHKFNNGMPKKDNYEFLIPKRNFNITMSRIENLLANGRKINY